MTNHLNFTKDLYPGVTEYEIVNLQYSGWEQVSIRCVVFKNEFGASDIFCVSIGNLCFGFMTMSWVFIRGFSLRHNITYNFCQITRYCFNPHVHLITMNNKIIQIKINIFILQLFSKLSMS